MSPDADLKRKIVPLIEVARDLHEKLAAIIQEVDDILDGKASIGAKMKEVESAWRTAWSSRYQGEYVFDYAKDRPHMKRLLTKGRFTPADLQARMVGYITDSEKFYVERKHPFGLFVSSVNRWAPVNGTHRDEEEAKPVGCQHTPPCRSDQEHTRRRHAEMRA